MAANNAQSQNDPYSHPSNFTTVDGVIHFAGITKEFLKDYKDLPVKVKDVFIDSYPKSGTTWVSEIVRQIYNDGKIDLADIGGQVLFLEFIQFRKRFETKQELNDTFLNHCPRIFKTHLQYHQVPMGGGDQNKPKYIYVARNPKDVAVSFYHHYKSIKRYEFVNRSWDEFFQMFYDDRVLFGGWIDHVLGWWAHRHDNNILFLKYEDMKKDLPGTVQQIARFVGKQLSSKMIQQISNQTSFEVMSGDKGARFLAKEELEPNPNAKFVRKGVVGDWKNYFTEEQSRRFDEMYEKKMAGIGLELEFS